MPGGFLRRFSGTKVIGTKAWRATGDDARSALTRTVYADDDYGLRKAITDHGPGPPFGSTSFRAIVVDSNRTCLKTISTAATAHWIEAVASSR
jgi:hypothetical protein